MSESGGTGGGSKARKTTANAAAARFIRGF
jgi:hypothetical protein